MRGVTLTCWPCPARIHCSDVVIDLARSLCQRTAVLIKAPETSLTAIKSLYDVLFAEAVTMFEDEAKSKVKSQRLKV